MTKTSSLTLAAAALVAVAGLSLPALAEDDSGTSFDDDLVAAALRDRGIDVIALAEYPEKIRATVVLPDGSTAFRYFSIHSLQPVSGPGDGGSSPRVLSRVDVGIDRTVLPTSIGGVRRSRRIPRTKLD
jgi:hypothetical protein